MGHRRIGFVGEPAENSFGFVSSARREQGYLSALARAGVAADPALVRHGGTLIASGFLSDERDAVLAAFPSLTLDWERTENGWVGVAMRKA